MEYTIINLTTNEKFVFKGSLLSIIEKIGDRIKKNDRFAVYAKSIRLVIS